MGKTKEQIEQEEFEEVTHSGFLVLFFIVATIVIGALCFIAGMVYSSYLNKNEERYEEKINNDEEEKNEISNEKLVENEKIIEELKKRKDILFDAHSLYKIDDFFSNSVDFNKVSLDKKLSMVLVEMDTEDLNEDDLKEIKQYKGDFESKIDDIKLVDDKYYDFFGKKPEKYMELQTRKGRFLYDENNNKYYYEFNAGTGTCNGGIISYDYSFTEDDYNYYLYSSLGSVRMDKCNYNKDYNTVFSDPIQETEFAKDYDDTFVLDETNYEEFSKYKITFKKGPKNGIFFSRIERVQ